MRVHAVFAFSLATALGAQDRIDPIYTRIRIEAYEHTTVMANLRHLCDSIGPRLTGSPALDQASRWAEERFAALGLKASRESYAIPQGWSRVRARARLIEPVERELHVASGGWSSSTEGTVRAAVVDLRDEPAGAPERGPRPATAAQRRARIEGHIVLTGRTPEERRGIGQDPYALAAARLIDSQKPYALFDMGPCNWGPPCTVGGVPAAFLISEDFLLIERLLADGHEVTAEIDVQNEATDEPVEVHNVVAEIEGRDETLGEQIVFAGAHLDSWDLGSGATDDGAGAMVVLEAARILQGLEQKPRRTIRFVLFSGGEQGFAGSRAYVERHGGELARHAAGLVMEGGAGGLIGLSLGGQTPFLAPSERWFAPVEDLSFTDTSLRSRGSGDHLVFQRAGVPAFLFNQEEADYYATANSQADTFDKIVESNLQQAACVMATGLWAIANQDGDIPRFDGALLPRAERRGR